MTPKSILLFIGAVIALLLAFRYGLRAVSEPPPPKPSPDPVEWASWKEETFGDLGFSLRHPPDDPTVVGAMTVRTAGPFLAMRSFPRLSIIIPKTRYKGTTFLDGYVTVHAGNPVADGQVACEALVKGPGTAEHLSKQAVFTGATFIEGGVSVGDRATIAESLVYHVFFKGRCIEIDANLFSVNPRSAPRLKGFDRIDAWKQLNDIVRTFRPLAR
ncbi:MAG TPA: hypothetical protein VL426_07440 [Candidatus Binatia bacterium]|nr:hypothetical protein [Candidatus Binatia bacterium]